nr:hypothetical protein [Parasporobacterium sp.]
MFKNMKKKLMVIISAILVFTMIPSVTFAKDAGETAKEFFENLTSDYEFTYRSYKKDTKTVKEDQTISRYIHNPGEKMGHGTLNAKVILNGDGTYNLVLTFTTSSRNVSKIKLSDGREFTSTKSGNDYVFTITNFDPTMLQEADFKSNNTELDDEGDTIYPLSHMLVLDVTATYSKAKTDDDGTEHKVGDPDNLTDAKIGFCIDKTKGESESNAAVGVLILRTGNFSDEYMNQPYTKAYQVVSYDAANKTATVKMSGSYSKMFLGTYQDAQNADASKITTLTPENDETLITIPVSALDTAITVSLYQDNMGGNWRQYSFEFYKKEIKPTDVVETDTALVVDAKEETVVAVRVSQLANATKPLEIKTKLGTVSFDTTALA